MINQLLQVFMQMPQELQSATFEEDEKRSSLAMFYKIYNDQTRIDTGKYLKPLSRVSCRVNSQAYDQVPVAYLLF